MKVDASHRCGNQGGNRWTRGLQLDSVAEKDPDKEMDRRGKDN